MTVKELHTFTDADIDVITDALKIANTHYRSLAELSIGSKAMGYGRMPMPLSSPSFRETFEQQAREAADLQLKIEASR